LLEKIKKETVELLGVSSLPTSPTSPGAIGGGYSAEEMKLAFDRLAIHIIEQYNLLIEAIHSDPSASILGEIPTGISDGHTLRDLMSDITGGDFAVYMKLGNRSILEEMQSLSQRVTALEEKI
jgi:hypothetical protein